MITGISFLNETDVFSLEIVFFPGRIDNSSMSKCDIECSYLGEDRQSGFRILVHSHHLPLNCHCRPSSSLMDFIVCNDSVHLIDPSFNTHWFMKNAEVSILVWIWTATINEEEKIIIKILLTRSTDKSNEIFDNVSGENW